MLFRESRAEPLSRPTTPNLMSFGTTPSPFLRTSCQCRTCQTLFLAFAFRPRVSSREGSRGGTFFYFPDLRFRPLSLMAGLPIPPTRRSREGFGCSQCIQHQWRWFPSREASVRLRLSAPWLPAHSRRVPTEARPQNPQFHHPLCSGVPRMMSVISEVADADHTITSSQGCGQHAEAVSRSRTPI